MEALTTVSVPSSIPQKRNVGFPEKTLFLQGQVIKFPFSKRKENDTKFKSLNVRAQGSGTTNLGTDKANPKNSPKDLNLAFVAGATGRVGSRAVRELLKLGFRVRAGVRSAERAQSLVESVKQMSVAGESQSVEKLEIVECDLEKKDQIGPALGNASVVLCCIGASEKEISDITGPYRIDYLATKNLIEAATTAKVNHFILVTSLGTNKFGFPAAILNLFWGVLIWKRKAEESLLASGLPYTIVRPGGMERPTDSFKETHNLTLSQGDTLFGGLVSNLQVAELLACIAKNRALSYFKIVEVVAETTAPLNPMEDLLKTIPSQPASKDSIPVEEPIIAAAPRPLSPYTAYEDLKPPSSPTPIPSRSQKPPPDINDGVVENGPPNLLTQLWQRLTNNPSNDNPKPPETPSSNTPEKAVIDETRVEPKPRPLSPFTMYEDMKPPTSPAPSTPSPSKS